MIVVTGASGLLGANLVAQLVRGKEEVVAVYGRHPVRAPGARARRIDLADAGAIDRAVGELAPRWILHCAAITDADWCQDHPAEARRINADATRVLARAARREGASMLYISTDSVFDGRRGDYREEDEPRPLNAYAESKLAGERAVGEELDGGLVVRTVIYGWNMQDKKSLAEWVLGRMRAGQTVPGFRDAVFSPLLVNDLGGILEEMMDKKLRGVYHAGSSAPCSKHEFARRLVALYGGRPDDVASVSVGDSALKAPRPLNVSLRTEKLCRALGRPMPEVAAGLERFKALEDSGFAARLKTWGEVTDDASV